MLRANKKMASELYDYPNSEEYNNAESMLPPLERSNDNAAPPQFRAVPGTSFTNYQPMQQQQQQPIYCTPYKGGEPTEDNAPNCLCGRRTKWYAIKNPASLNCGKYFFCCSKRKAEACSFWQLAGGTAYVAPELSIYVTCDCRKPAKVGRQKKAGRNQGRVFYSCAGPKLQACDYFKWEPGAGGGHTVSL